MGIPINTDKKKNMITKSKNDTYTNFICDNSNIHEVTSYKYLGIDIQHREKDQWRMKSLFFP